MKSVPGAVTRGSVSQMFHLENARKRGGVGAGAMVWNAGIEKTLKSYAGICGAVFWLLHEVWVWTCWKQSPWCRIHLQPGTLGRTDGECQGGGGKSHILDSSRHREGRRAGRIPAHIFDCRCGPL